MTKTFHFLSAMLLCMLLCPEPGIAQAAEKKFIVMPFTVNAPQSYNYLAKAVPGTLQSKLGKPGQTQGTMGTAPARSAEDATRALRQANADYAIWGMVNIMGNDCTIDVHSIDKNGKTWSKSGSGSLGSLTTSVQNLAASLGNEVMGIQVAGSPVFRTGAPRTGAIPARSQSDIVVNETGQQQVYINPQFRYQGAGSGDGSRIRTQRLKQSMVDMAVGDFNGDGKNEVAVLADHDLVIYLWEENNTLKELGRQRVSTSDNNFSMRAMDINRDGASDLVISTYEEENCRPYSYLYSFKGNKFSLLAERIPYFASVMRLPPTFAPVLVGQAYDSMKLFATGVHQLAKTGGKYTLGSRIGLPSGANVYNVAWIPAGKDNPSDLLVMLMENEKIRIFQGNATSPLHTTMDSYSGSAIGMEHYKTMPGFGVDKDTTAPSKYFAPMRLLAADIGNTGENVLLLNRPISTAAQFFENYRYFPQGEIHALFWDGVGMALKWKTRRIRGSVAEIDLGDVNNDGVLDLVVGINTAPQLGVGSRSSMLTAYPLDVNQADPNTPADLGDFEVTPN